jgi:hypothetical protein
MKRACIIAGVFAVIAAVSSAQIPGFVFSPKKGAILQAWVEPQSPNSSEAVTLHISIADYLQLNNVEIKKTATMLTVKIYWDEPANGSSSSTGNTPVYHEESLGVLSPGAYFVTIISYYKGRMANAKNLSFRVAEAPSPWASQNIDDVWVEPENPRTSDTVTLHVSGKWPTSGFSLYRMITMALQKTITVNMYWSSPGDAAATVVVPYEHETVLRYLFAGTYTVKVSSYLDGKLVDTEEMTFSVTQAD